MKIEEFDLHRLRNDEHYQFHTECKGLIETSTPEKLGLEALWPPYFTCFGQEVLAMERTRKSAFTEQLAEADASRDDIYKGLLQQVEAAEYHYMSDLRLAGNRLKVAFDHYGDLTRKSYDQETADITSLISDLTHTLADDVALLGLGGWLTEMETRNRNFNQLMQTRYSEETGKVQPVMKDVRIAIDDVYRGITERIISLINVNGDGAYADFANALNTRIARYRTMLAQHSGRNNQAEEQPEPAK
ncbi:MAG: DUF6261 family protein [Bacteroidota bacterium]